MSVIYEAKIVPLEDIEAEGEWIQLSESLSEAMVEVDFEQRLNLADDEIPYGYFIVDFRRCSTDEQDGTWRN